jgi:uncharacterized membrane-anchored protein
MTSRPAWAKLGVIAAVQLTLVGVAGAGPLSARLNGDEYLLKVLPVDPIDPFRGAYVALNCPTLYGPAGQDDTGGSPVAAGEQGRVFVPLVREGAQWVGGPGTRTRPASGPYLRCDDSAWTLRCGIESLFLPQSRARAVEGAVLDGQAVARVKVDRRGNAALMAVEVAPAG